MSTIDEVLKKNAEFALNYDPALISPRPQKHLAVLACMDTRITLAALGLKPQDALRPKEEQYKKLVAGKDLSDDELIRIMAANPEIIQRPLVVKGKKAVLARPVERLKDLGV